MALKDKKDVIYQGEILASQLKKLQGKGFANFIAKQSDELIKALCARVLDEIFADFNPSADFIPFCVIATEKYADNLISTSSVLEVLLVFKENAGFNVKFILKKLVAALEGSNLKLNIKICELDEIFERPRLAASAISAARGRFIKPLAHRFIKLANLTRRKISNFTLKI